MKQEQGRLLFSPSDLVRYVQLPFSVLMVRLLYDKSKTFVGLIKLFILDRKFGNLFRATKYKPFYIKGLAVR
jgi:hypothetical protein